MLFVTFALISSSYSVLDLSPPESPSRVKGLSEVVIPELATPLSTSSHLHLFFSDLPSWITYILVTIGYLILQTIIGMLINAYCPYWSDYLFGWLPHRHRNWLGPLMLTFIFLFLSCFIPRLHRLLRPLDPQEVARNEELHFLRRENALLRQRLEEESRV